MLESAQALVAEHAALERELADPVVASDPDRSREVNKRYAALGPTVAAHHAWVRARGDVEAARELARDDASFAEELPVLEATLTAAEDRLRRLLIPRDPDDDRDVILEVKAGEGGEESALFAGDLLRMYTRFAERNRWQVEMVSESASDLGGYREVIVRLVGNGAYSKLKFESGGHRVQRVPATETQGRIHTSACTVAVMPEADEVEDVNINPADLRIDTYRASGAGGQHINKTDSAVRLTHLPTGIVVECQDDRSQHKNKAQALKVLAARIKDVQLREQQSKEAATRKSLIGSGDRSERIRTYNFPQGRMTDHRINLTLYKLDFIMDGDLTELTNALAAEHQAELLAALGD
ncbi:MAG: peptide chain release factor 1 [Telluria sp.]